MLIEGTPEQLTALFTALAQARKAFKEIKKDTDGQEGNRNYKYAPLHNLVDATIGPLSENGLLILQPFGIDGEKGVGTITTILQHVNGGRVSETATFPLENDIKLIGGQSTYMARYAYQRLLVLDGDDDADASDSKQRPRQSAPQSRPVTKEQDSRIQELARKLELRGQALTEACKKVTGKDPADCGFDDAAKFISAMERKCELLSQAAAG